jgi:excisionase family DNA binding protein
MLLPIGEASRRLGVSTQTLRDWEQRGVIAPVRLPGSRHRRYLPAEVDRVRRDVLGLPD